jgi:hypothetical protein
MIFRFREPFYYKRSQLARNFDWNRALQKARLADRWTSPDWTSERLQLRLHTSVKNEFDNHRFGKVRGVETISTMNLTVLVI